MIDSACSNMHNKARIYAEMFLDSQTEKCYNQGERKAAIPAESISYRKNESYVECKALLRSAE